jgi:hypothetical protein
MHKSLTIAFGLAVAAVAAGAPLLAGCLEFKPQAQIFYNFQGLRMSTDTDHYEHWADVNGAVVSLGCFRVEPRSNTCNDVSIELLPDGGVLVTPVKRPSVVLCAACPCDAPKIQDPCDPEGAMVTDGIVAGTLDVGTSGGITIDTLIRLEDAASLYVSLEQNADADPGPGDVLMRGPLFPDGAVSRAVLTTSSQTMRASGTASILFTSDSVSP